MTKELKEDAQRLNEAEAALKSAKSSEEKADAFAAGVRALAGTKDAAVEEAIESYMKAARALRRYSDQ